MQVAGSWKDIAGKDGIDWTSWNVNTVERFLDWLYTGDYRCAYPTEIRGSGEFARDKTVDEACGGDLSGPSERRNDLAVAMTKDQVPRTLRTGPLTPLKDLHWDGLQNLGKALSSRRV